MYIFACQMTRRWKTAEWSGGLERGGDKYTKFIQNFIWLQDKEYFDKVNFSLSFISLTLLRFFGDTLYSLFIYYSICYAHTQHKQMHAHNDGYVILVGKFSYAFLVWIK